MDNFLAVSMGFKDAISVHRLLYCPTKVWLAVLPSFILNGALFLGFHLILLYVIRPILPIGEQFFVYAYYILWLGPLFAISSILNAQHYSVIAAALRKTAVNTRSITLQISELIYSPILNIAFLIHIIGMGISPYFGKIFGFILTCWLYSFSVLDYCCWSSAWGLDQRLDYLENHWLYFLGYGAPVSIVYYMFPYFVSVALTSLLFPLFIILAMHAKPVKPTSQILPEKLSIFFLAKLIAALILYLLDRFANWVKNKRQYNSTTMHIKY